MILREKVQGGMGVSLRNVPTTYMSFSELWTSLPEFVRTLNGLYQRLLSSLCSTLSRSVKAHNPPQVYPARWALWDAHPLTIQLS